MAHVSETLGRLRRLFFHQAAYHAEQFRKVGGLAHIGKAGRHTCR